MVRNRLYNPDLLPYISTMVLFWIAGIVVLILKGYEGSFFWINGWHLAWLDGLMPYYTELASGILISPLIILFVARKQPILALGLVLTMLSVSLIVNGLKMGIFPDWHRPAKLFEQGSFHFISLGGERYHAFPSGHSTVAATELGFLAYILRKEAKLFQIPIALIAISLGWSRIYIGVHFLGDVLAGLLLGSGLAFLGVQYIIPWLNRKIRQSAWPLLGNILFWFSLLVLASNLIRLL